MGADDDVHGAFTETLLDHLALTGGAEAVEQADLDRIGGKALGE